MDGEIIVRKFLISIKTKALWLRDMPKSIYFNFRCLPKEQARKLPIRIRWNTKLGILEKNCIQIQNLKIKKGMIQLGYRGGKFVSQGKSYITISKGGEIIFKGTCICAEGWNICVEGGKLTFGSNFFANRNLQIECEKDISFGDDVLVGWNVRIRDTDGHAVICDNIYKDFRKEIIIHDHVWISSDSTILKGSKIEENSVVACNSTVCGLVSKEKNCLIAGTPSKVKKQNIQWIK